jgi:hypothetical protein
VKRIFLTLLTLTALFSAVSAQDRIKLSASYLNTEFQPNPVENLEYLKGFSLDADARILEGNGWRLGGVLSFQRTFDQQVISNYLDLEDGEIYNIQRDVNTYAFGAQLSKKVGPVYPFGAFLLGVRKLHEDFDYGVVRKYRFGADLGVGSIFIRPFFVEFERGRNQIEYNGTADQFTFKSGTTHKYGAGVGFRF